MPFERFGASPFVAGAGSALVDLGKAETDFARTLENNKILLQKRALDLQHAEAVQRGKAEAIRAAQTEKGLHQEALKFRADQAYRRATLAETRRGQDLTAEEHTLQREDRLDREAATREEKQAKAANAWREERNTLIASGFREVAPKERGAVAAGETLYTDITGKVWKGQTKAASELAAKQQEWSAKYDWDQAHPDPDKIPPTLRGYLANVKSDLDDQIRLRDQGLKAIEAYRKELESPEGPAAALAQTDKRIQGYKDPAKVPPALLQQKAALEAKIADLNGRIRENDPATRDVTIRALTRRRDLATAAPAFPWPALGQAQWQRIAALDENAYAGLLGALTMLQDADPTVRAGAQQFIYRTLEAPAAPGAPAGTGGTPAPGAGKTTGGTPVLPSGPRERSTAGLGMDAFRPNPNKLTVSGQSVEQILAGYRAAAPAGATEEQILATAVSQGALVFADDPTVTGQGKTAAPAGATADAAGGAAVPPVARAEPLPPLLGDLELPIGQLLERLAQHWRRKEQERVAAGGAVNTREPETGIEKKLRALVKKWLEGETR